MPPARRTRLLAAGLLAVVASELAIAAVAALTSGISWAAAVGSFTVTNGAMGLGFAVCGVLLAAGLWWGLAGTGPILGLLVIPLIPAAVTVAILRYQLLDIRLVFSRTLAYEIVTGVLADV
jgi:hypothetical protein